MKCFAFVMLLLFQLGDSSPTCPNSEDILPCECSYNKEIGTQIMCDGRILESELETVFQATFPIKKLDQFILRNNDFIPELSLPIFNDITFKKMQIADNKLFHINETFFDGQENSLTELRVDRNKLNSEGFPYSVLPNLENLLSLNLNSNYISSLPVSIPPNNITELYYQYNAINEIKQGTFENCNSLTTLDLSNNLIATLDKGIILTAFTQLSH